jgi:hypothetical protein
MTWMAAPTAVGRAPSERRAAAFGAAARREAAERIGAWPATALVVALAAALFLSFVSYGYELSDEGNILYQILRTYRGERPYLDFETGYTPAVFYLNALLFDWFGVSAVPLRIALACVNATAVLLIFRLALRFAPVAESACAALTYAVFLPFFAGQFASFNIPYPAWYAVTAWLATELAVVRATETKRRVWILAAGALAGVAFSFKAEHGRARGCVLGALALSRVGTAPRPPGGVARRPPPRRGVPGNRHVAHLRVLDRAVSCCSASLRCSSSPPPGGAGTACAASCRHGRDPSAKESAISSPF